MVPVQTNLLISSSYKDLLFKKLYQAIICSVLSQLLILHLCLIGINGDPLNPLSWIRTSFDTITSFTAWLYVIPHLIIVFAQCLICAKDYVLRPTFSTNRFSKFISVFSIHNFILLLLHVLIGIVQVWLVLSLVGGDFKGIIGLNELNTSYLVEETMFVQLGGLWIGFYYFVTVYISDKHLSFPIIQQKKTTQFKTSLIPLMQKSLNRALWPCTYFILFYSFCGTSIKHSIANMLYITYKETFFFKFYLFHYIFSVMYFFNMNLIKLFFSLFLTEPVEFPLMKKNERSLTLQESVKLEKLPIIQNLACLDLYRLSLWSPNRRQLFFTLSQPGEHPHNWNSLVENILELYNSYINILTRSDNIQEKSSGYTDSIVYCQTPVYNKFKNLRNMTSIYSSPNISHLLNINSPEKNKTVEQPLENIFWKFKTMFSSFLAASKTFLGINYLFGELPQANIKMCLSDVHLIIWSSLGLAELICASIKEDRYGIVQKDLPKIISTLVHFSQVLDKLNKVPALTRKIGINDNVNYNMKTAVSSSLKRSLFLMCYSFKNYLLEIPLTKEIGSYLNSHILVDN